MKKEIIINSTSSETRIAITEDGRLVELFFENPDLKRNVGDLYLGKIARVLPGIRAAFINLGFPQDAFLHFSDIETSPDDYKSLIGDDEDVDEDEDDDAEENGIKRPERSGQFKDKNPAASSLEKGMDIIVQISKEPVGNKGVRVTAKVSLPGRYLVLIPFTNKIGISRKIYNYREKRRLRTIIKKRLPEGHGAIIRTVAAGQEENLILDDLNKLISTWNEIENKIKNTKPPVLLYKDVSMTNSVIRDLFRDDVSRVVVDSKKIYKEIKNYIEETSPESLQKLELYEGSVPIFDAYNNIDKQIEESLDKKVMIKNYGYIVIETTEAMTVVDVNSGKYAKSKDQEANSLKINIEAAKEIARQARLRDIGGIIVVDFIDLYEEPNKKKLHEEIKKEFRRDRAKATILPMSEFGIVQITRQRIRQNIIHRVSAQCPMCSGTGRVQSRMAYITDIERWLQRYKGADNSIFLRLRVNPLIKDYLTSGFINKILKLCIKYRVIIKLETDKEFALDEYRFYQLKSKIDITDEYSN
jgi:ribonuclease G